MNGRLILAACFGLGGLLIAFAGASPQATLTASEALEADAGAVSVKGEVESVDRANRTFVISDGEGELLVRMSSELPAAVREGGALVAKGELVREGGSQVLEASEVLLGCPSKYQA